MSEGELRPPIASVRPKLEVRKSQDVKFYDNTSAVAAYLPVSRVINADRQRISVKLCYNKQ